MPRRTTVAIATVSVATFSLAFAASALSANAAAEPPRIDVAHSAQLLVDAQDSGSALLLRVRRAADQKPVDSKDVTVSIDGKTQTITRTADGSYSLPADELRSKGDKALEIVVGHDGIREVLDAKMAPLEQKSASSLITDHKQLAWWILNVAVLLVGAMVLSRKKAF